MNTFYLKHDNVEQLIAALEESGVIYDYIGIITKHISDDNYQNIEGYHANILCDDVPDSLVCFLVDIPNNPVRGFFL